MQKLKSKNVFDRLFFALILCALFTVGFHIGKDETREVKESVCVTVSLEKIKGYPRDDDIVLIDGKHECRFVSLENGKMSLLCDGYFSDSGFLFSGSKYLSKNQPIKANQEWGYFEGRILKIEKQSTTRVKDTIK